MADQQSGLKYFCKICKKGFLCGRALGGHMRAHGIGDENGSFDDDEDDDQASDWEDKSHGGNSTPPRNKRMYALRTKPNRLRNCRVCEHCGKEFESWKSFLGHGKCNSFEDVESLMSSIGSGEEDEDERKSYGWAKRKRSYRADVSNNNYNSSTTGPSSEEEDLANCLMMLSNATVYPYLAADQPEESSASASREEEKRNSISYVSPIMARLPSSANSAPKGLFECKACKKVFNSHQALGGHRASHKKVKGCFAARLHHVDQKDAVDMLASNQELIKPSKSTSKTLQLDQRDSNISSLGMSKKKSGIHECSICHRIFSSGQALGGHKRCHWITSNAPDTSPVIRFQELQEQIERVRQVPTMFTHTEQALDLNMPAPSDQSMIDVWRDPKNQLKFETSTDIFLQPWGSISIEIEHEHRPHLRKEPEENDIKDNNNGGENKTNNKTIICDEPNLPNNTDDKADNLVKLAKLCEFKDHTNKSGNSSPWLQVGIGSSNIDETNP